MSALVGWRCFPWNPVGAAGEFGAPDWVAPTQQTGRFDLHGQPPVRYFGESAAHAVAEVLQGFRGSPFLPAMLQRRGWPLAVAPFQYGGRIPKLVDLTDPATLLALGIRPDTVASHDRSLTQGLARQIYDTGAAGLRWWSALSGAWHTTVVFTDRWPAERWRVEPPRELRRGDPALEEALQFLRIG